MTIGPYSQWLVYIKSKFLVQKKGGATGDATARLGPNLSQVFDVAWIDGCNLACRNCEYDRTGEKHCYGGVQGECTAGDL